MTGLYLLNILNGNVEGGLQRRALGGGNHYLVVLKVKSGPDTSRVPHYKGIAVTENTRDGVTAIPVFGRLSQYLGYVQIFSYQLTDLDVIIMSLSLILIEKALVFGIQKMTYFFQYGNGISFLFRMLSQVVQLLQQLVNIRHIEVTRDHQVARLPIVLAQERMAIFDAVFTMRTVT